MISPLKRLTKTEFWNLVEQYRYGIMPMVLIAQCCYASVAICYICALPVKQQIVPLTLVAFSTMAANAANIMLLPMKWVIGLFINCIIIATLMMIYALI